MSVRPLAGLLGVPVDDLLTRFADERAAIEAVRTSYPQDRNASDEARYGGDPV